MDKSDTALALAGPERPSCQLQGSHHHHPQLSSWCRPCLHPLDQEGVNVPSWNVDTTFSLHSLPRPQPVPLGVEEDIPQRTSHEGQRDWEGSPAKGSNSGPPHPARAAPALSALVPCGSTNTCWTPVKTIPTRHSSELPGAGATRPESCRPLPCDRWPRLCHLLSSKKR